MRDGWEKYPEGDTVFEGVMVLARQYYEGSIDSKGARESIISLAEGKKGQKWLEGALSGLCDGGDKSLLYDLGGRVSGGAGYTGLTLITRDGKTGRYLDVWERPLTGLHLSAD